MKSCLLPWLALVAAFHAGSPRAQAFTSATQMPLACVPDTTPPSITVPADIVVEATETSGATVTFSTSATDAVDGEVATLEVPASGSVFPLGSSTVTVTAVDAAGNSANASFVVTVLDTTSPVITVPDPGPLRHEAGRLFVDPGATATDIVAGDVALASSTIVNGLVPGAYVLTYDFTDAAGNAAAQVTVTVNVVDTAMPGLISYQGRISSGGVNFSGTGLFKFALVDGAGLVTYWSNDSTAVAGGPPTNPVPTEVTDGLYALRLGDTSLPNMHPIPATAFDSADVRLRIWFSDGITGWEQLAPDQRIASAGYAMRAKSATTVDDGGITESKFASSDIVVANLNASGQAGVPSGGIVLSINENPELEAAGYVKVGTAAPNGSWQARAWQIRDQSVAGTPPSARFFHSAVWTGNEMIVWGGKNQDAFLNDGGRYDPEGNRWSGMTVAGAPDARCLHSSVWTGTEMIVWGGLNAGGTPGDFGRYDPGVGAWTPGSITNAPAGRVFHTAVWTGTEMIVWGGEASDGTSLNDGGRYNPMTDTWVAITTSNAPSPRRSHSAVWTGTEMIVWGGTAPPDALSDGKRYDPLSDTWSDLTAVGAPGARSHHTAVWTGSRMIVWGGNGEGGHFTDVHLYDPAADGWTTGAAVDAPAGRDFHTALWTGTEMIVCGGYGDHGILINGARYNPSVNSWTPVNAAGNVSVRWLHTAVWAGTDMIIWGGLAGASAPLLGDTRFFGPVRTVLVYQRQ